MSRHFSSYLRKRNCGSLISMKAAINSIKRHNPGEKVTILIALSHLDQMKINAVGFSKAEKICGPTLDQLPAYKRLFDFLRNECQAELIFIVDCFCPCLNCEIYKEKAIRKRERYDNDISIIDAINAKENYREVAARVNHVPTDRILADSIKFMAKEFGMVWYGIEVEPELTISQLATSTKAQILLSKENYLLTTQGYPRYWWNLSTLNYNKMLVREYKWDVIMESLHMTPSKRRLLAALLSPQIIFLLKECLQERFCDTWLVDKIDNIIYDFKPTVTHRDVDRIANAIDKSDKSALIAQKLKEMADFYVVPIELSNQNQYASSLAYDIIYEKITHVSITFYDFRYWESKSVDLFSLFSLFYGRFAGVVIQRINPASRSDRKSIFIFCKSSHEEDFAIEEVEIRYPKEHTMHGNGLELSVDYLRFMLDVELTVGKIERFTSDDRNKIKLLDYLTVYYMYENKMLTEPLADIILFAVEEYPNAEQQLKELPDELNMDVFHATFTFVFWRYYVRVALENCGLSSEFIDPESRLHGVLVQNAYQKYLEQPDELLAYEAMGRVRFLRLHNME